MCLPVCDLKLTRRAALSVFSSASEVGAARLQDAAWAGGRVSEGSFGEMRAGGVSDSLTMDKNAGRAPAR